jgi:hypothetical protein
MRPALLGRQTTSPSKIRDMVECTHIVMLHNGPGSRTGSNVHVLQLLRSRLMEIRRRDKAENADMTSL